MLNPATMTTAQLLAWEREVARLEWVALLRAETVFEPTPAPEWVAFLPPATSLEEWAGQCCEGMRRGVRIETTQ